MYSSELLRELADSYQIATGYRGQDGQDIRIGDDTLVATLKACGLPMPEITVAKTATDDPAQTTDNSWQTELTDEILRTELDKRRSFQASEYLAPTIVARAGDDNFFVVRVIDGDPVSATVRPEATENDAANNNSTEATKEQSLLQREHNVPKVCVDGLTYGEAAFSIPELTPGWYIVNVDSPGRGTAQATLIVTPACLPTTEHFEQHPATGVMVQLYSLRDKGAWGMGDFDTLRQLAAICPGDFVLTNPLHAAEPYPPTEDSPYLPTSRRFINPIYIRPEQIIEVEQLPATDRQKMERIAEELAATNTTAEQIDRNPIYKAKLQALFTIFQVPREVDRQRSFDAFRSVHGESLQDFAQWSAQHSEAFWTSIQPDFPVGELTKFYAWLQWIADEQLAAAQRAAMDHGRSIGLMSDLAVGVHPGGADSHNLAPYLAHRCSVGAPPDGYNQHGQDWSQPPWDPRALAESGYRPWRNLVRTALRHAGGLRVDHILGLFRLWWIPRPPVGTPSDPRKGTYVYYDHKAMVGVLMVEAFLAGAVVVGEDLGTFDPWVQDYLRERGIMGTSILWFENTSNGPRPAADYRSRCLASVGTHDLPPTAGYLAGEHVTLRERLGVLTTDPAQELAQDLQWQNEVLSLVKEDGFFTGAANECDFTDLPREQRPETGSIIAGLHAFLNSSPAALTCVNLVDVVGDIQAQNQPGTTKELYPNWCIPLCDGEGTPVLLEDLPHFPAWTDPRFWKR